MPAACTRTLILAACVTLASATAVAAQPAAPPPAEAPAAPDFFTRFDFHLSASAFAKDDQRFKWDTSFGGDFDLIDYVVGRASILVDYEAVLGNEYRPFDPNQAYYALEVSSSLRAGPTEIAGVFHHVSRHVSDRPKRFAIAWNVLGARVLQRFTSGETTVDARVDVGRIVQHSWVDYSWTADVDVIVRRPVATRLGMFARGYGEAFGVERATMTRGIQTGGKLEGGVRLTGRGGAVELFGGYETRIDADPIDRIPVSWVFAGFRFVGN